jgi:hypothetical protein
VDGNSDRDGDGEDDDLRSSERFFWKRKNVFLVLSTELYSLQTKFLPEPGKKRKQSHKIKKNFQMPKR